jgi:predicted nucleic acid-binding protein
MAVFIPDASVVIPWCAGDEASQWTDKLLERLKTSDSALVPPLWAYEVTNTLLHLKRRGRITGPEMARFLDDLRSLPIMIDSEGMERIFDRVAELADRHRLTIYDASYLELTLRTGHPLATKDTDLEAAARAEQSVLVDRA